MLVTCQAAVTAEAPSTHVERAIYHIDPSRGGPSVGLRSLIIIANKVVYIIGASVRRVGFQNERDVPIC